MEVDRKCPCDCQLPVSTTNCSTISAFGYDYLHGTTLFLRRLERTGRLRANVVAPKITSFVDCDYTWALMERMELLYNAGYTSVDTSESKYVKGEVFYRNPGKNFKYLSVGVDSDVDGSFM